MLDIINCIFNVQLLISNVKSQLHVIVCIKNPSKIQIQKALLLLICNVNVLHAHVHVLGIKTIRLSVYIYLQNT